MQHIIVHRISKKEAVKCLDKYKKVERERYIWKSTMRGTQTSNAAKGKKKPQNNNPPPKPHMYKSIFFMGLLILRLKVD